MLPRVRRARIAVAAAVLCVPLLGAVGAARAGLASVVCFSASNCIAGGDTFGFAGGPAALMERWNGRKWLLLPTQRMPWRSSSVNLLSMSCVSPTSCIAVGHDIAPRNVAYHWNGSRAVVVPMAATQNAVFLGVSCPTATSCLAVGFTVDPTGSFHIPAAQRWNGKTWTVTPVPVPPVTSGGLTAVSCVSVSSCVAVGSANRDFVSYSWNGATWSGPVTMPDRTGYQSIHCFTPASCIATGYTAASWNGTSWSTLPSPVGLSTWDGQWIFGLYCTSPTNCIGVGTYQEAYVFYGLAERWNGTSWTIMPLTQYPTLPKGGLPTGSYLTDLTGVGCALAMTRCVAVGAAGVDSVSTYVWPGSGAWTYVAPQMPGPHARH